MAWYIGGGYWTKEDEARYPEAMMAQDWVVLDGNPRELELLDKTQDEGEKITGSSPTVGRRISDKNVPTRLDRRGATLAELPLRDVESYWDANLLVCKAFRDLLEEMEPGVHQFFPMQVLVNGEPVATYYWFICCTRIATLSREHCDPPLTPCGSYKQSPWGQHQNDRVVLSRELIGQHHIWYDKFLGKTIYSDAFVERLRPLGLTGMRIRQVAEA